MSRSTFNYLRIGMRVNLSLKLIGYCAVVARGRPGALPRVRGQGDVIGPATASRFSVSGLLDVARRALSRG